MITALQVVLYENVIRTLAAVPRNACDISAVMGFREMRAELRPSAAAVGRTRDTD